MRANGGAEAKEITLSLLHDIFEEAGAGDVGVRLWDGARFPDESPRRATIVLNHPGALRCILATGTEVGLGERYLCDDFDFEGDVECAFKFADSLRSRHDGVLKKARAAGKLMSLPAAPARRDTRLRPAALRGGRHTFARDSKAVSYHYDVSNEFYALWLDRNMVYSCAYFRDAEESLDAAQERKLDYICRKLRLKPGRRLLDIGCGWGGLVIHAARNYGADATGITLSGEQAELARRRIEGAGLADRCRVQLLDYREVEGASAYDALVSVGMFEHVGERLLDTYFKKAMELLRPGGVFLNHGIAGRFGVKSFGRNSFSGAYVFPDGELFPVSTTLSRAEAAGFEVRDVESLREHYGLTLRYWVKRLEDNHERALVYVDEPTYRVWRLYMSGSAYGFNSGSLNVYQVLLSRKDGEGRSFQPLTREDWYL